MNSINMCRLNIRTKIPCGKECPPGKNVCDLCKKEMNKRIELRQRKPKNNISLEEINNLSVNDITILLNSLISEEVKL